MNGHRLLHCGVPTARPLALIQRRRWGLATACYLLTEKLDGVTDLRRDALSLEKLDSAEREAAKRSLIDGVARLARTLHERGFSQRDFKAANVLVQKADAKVFLIDLVGMKRRLHMPQWLRVKNLTRLHASFHDSSPLTRTDKLPS